MKRPSLYLDTTVWNFAFAEDVPDYKKATLDFFEKVRAGAFDVYFSDAVNRELKDAPQVRKRQILGLLEEISPIRLEGSDEVDMLAALYLKRKVLPAKSTVDALHLAYATCHGMDALLSWNFRHLANMNRRAKVIAVNFEQGYGMMLQLSTPLEVLDEKD